MLASLLVAGCQIAGVVSPSVVDALLADRSLSNEYSSVAERLIEYGETHLAYRLLCAVEPRQNAELFEWHKRDGDAEGMMRALSRPVRQQPTWLLELLYHQDDAHLDAAVARARAADAAGEDLGLFDSDYKSEIGLRGTESQIAYLCLCVAVSEYHELAARIFKKHLSAEFGGTDFAAYLAYISPDPAEIAVYFPNGLGVRTTDDLLVHASLREDGRYDVAALDALLNRPLWSPGETVGKASGNSFWTFLERLEASGRRADALAVVRRYSDSARAWIVEGPSLASFTSVPLLVKLGVTEPLLRAAQEIWSLAGPMEPSSDRVRQIEHAAMLFAFGGDDRAARAALELTRGHPSGSGLTTDSLRMQRLEMQGRHEEAFDVSISMGRYSVQTAVLRAVAAIGSAESLDDKRRLAKRLADHMVAMGSFSDWTEIDGVLLELGLERELRSLLDTVCANPYQNPREKDEAFLGYLALGDACAAAKTLDPSKPVGSAWLLGVLEGWSRERHGDAARLTDFDGRNLVEEGLRELSTLASQGPYWARHFVDAGRGGGSDPEVVRLVGASLQSCLLGMRAEDRAAAKLAVLKALVPHERSLVPPLHVQRALVAAVQSVP